MRTAVPLIFSTCALLVILVSFNANAQQDCKPFYQKFDNNTLMRILDMVDNADKRGKEVVVNKGRALVARKKDNCTIDIEVYDDDKQTMLLCTETVITCNSEEDKKKSVP